MKKTMKRMTAIAGVLALGLVAARAQSDGALLDALVKKGVLSDQEAEDIRADETKDYSKTSASKLAISDYVKKLQFYGDGRLRFDAYGQHFQYNAGGNSVNDRLRYRLRFGLLYTYSDQLSAGFELRSGTADDTANQTMGGMFTDSSINVSKIFVQYKPVDFATLIAGKFANPLYTTTDEVWSNDLTPEGGAETLSWTIPLGGGESAPAPSNPKDMKAIAPAPSGGSDSSLTIGLTMGQYYYINSNESTDVSSALIGGNNNDTWMFPTQIPITWKINDDVTFKVVPGFTWYTGGGNLNYDSGVPVNYQSAAGSSPTQPSWGYGTGNSSNDPVFYSPGESNYLNVVSAPGELDYKLFGQKLRTYWDFNWNVTAEERVHNVYEGAGAVYAAAPAGTIGYNSAGYGFVPAIPKTGTLSATPANLAAIRNQNHGLSDGVAWAIGEQIGDNKKKGDWSLLGEFRQVGLGSIDLNINGTDFANSYLNQQGFKLQGTYNFTDYLWAGVTYYNTWDYKNNLYTSLGGPVGSTGKPVVGTTQYMVSQSSMQRVQVDLNFKF
jgi:hypothetical protein